MLNTIVDFLRYIIKTPDTRRKEYEDAYLSEAVDLHDLEFRIRKLDTQSYEVLY